jgi:hypothetical protein
VSNGLTVLPPLIVPGSCPAGQTGVALTITTLGTGTLTISGSVTVTVNGTPTTIPIGPISTPALPGSTTTVSACTTL